MQTKQDSLKKKEKELVEIVDRHRNNVDRLKTELSNARHDLDYAIDALREVRYDICEGVTAGTELKFFEETYGNVTGILIEDTEGYVDLLLTSKHTDIDSWMVPYTKLGYRCNYVYTLIEALSEEYGWQLV